MTAASRHSPRASPRSAWTAGDVTGDAMSLRTYDRLVAAPIDAARRPKAHQNELAHGTPRDGMAEQASTITGPSFWQCYRRRRLHRPGRKAPASSISPPDEMMVLVVSFLVLVMKSPTAEASRDRRHVRH